MKDIPFLLPPPMFQVSQFEPGDLIGVQIESDIALLPIAKKPSADLIIKVVAPDGKIARYHYPHQWCALYLLGIHAATLSALGFSPASIDMAYDDTADIWVKNDPNRTWTASYDHSAGYWTLELDEVVAGKSQPKRVEGNNTYLFHIQQCMRQPFRRMQEKRL